MSTQTHRRNNLPWLNPTGLRQWLIYKPLAIVMAILLLPALSWIESGGAGARPFEAQAQVQSLCVPSGSTIFRNYCPNGIVFHDDLIQFENDAVNVYLAMHNLPQSDAHVVYDFGRQDLRVAVRGVMLALLLSIFTKPASQRSTHEQALYNWMAGMVQANEIAEYTNALSAFHSWQNDPCHFGLDPDIASTYGLSYDGNPYCFQTLTDVVGAPVPAESYFTAYGMTRSYQTPAVTFPYFSKLVTGTGVNVSEAAGISTAAYATVAATVSASFLSVVSTAESTLALPAIALETAGISADELIASIAAGTAGAVVGAVAIVLLGIAIGVTAAVELFQNQQQIQTITTDLTNGLNTATNTPPDLNAMSTDTSGTGLFKLQMSLASQTVPELSSTSALPVHQAGTDLSFATPSTVMNALTYQDWDGNVWSAQTWGGWFVQTCANPGNAICKLSSSLDQTDSIIDSIHYLDWNGNKRTASRLGNNFAITKLSPNSTDTPCPADALTQVSPNPDPSTCSSYVASSIQLTDGNGNKIQVSLSILGPAGFTSPAYLSFTPGIHSTQTITAGGNPAPAVCLTSSALSTTDFTLNGGNTCGTGSFTVAFNGDPQATNGDFSLTLTATGTGSPVIETFTVSVKSQLLIVSPNTLNLTGGVPVTFQVVATGNPPPSLSVDQSLGLGGLNFHDNGNGTATISGVWSAGISGAIQCFNLNTNTNQALPCGIIAHNSTQGTVEQQFLIDVSPAPPATITGCPTAGTCPTGAVFTAGIHNQALLTASGAITPVAWGFVPVAFQQGPPPAWLTLTDNGNGTATLSGTPPLGTNGTFNFGIAPKAEGAEGFAVKYPLTVVDRPLFTTPNTATFTVGTSSSFAIGANTGAIALDKNPPKGLAFGPGNPATISGVAAIGTGGQYSLTANDNAGAIGSASQTLTLNVFEQPQITSPNTASMFVGMPGSFAVTTIGYPSNSNHLILPNTMAPTSPSQGDGMFFTVTGLPGSLKFSNLDLFGYATTTLTIQGTPSAWDAGTYQVQITAQNGVGVAAQQTLTLNIVNLTGPAPASGTACNGNYNGTFQGSVTISAGQNCAFFGGGVTGNVTVNSGHLALNNAKITGNMAIQGGSGFSIGAGTAIAGNLSIQNDASGSTANQICGARVAGNVDISGNAVPIQIGSGNIAMCQGNDFGGNVGINSNTGAIQFSANTVTKNLSCSGNASITGSGNVAQKKQGQCAAF